MPIECLGKPLEHSSNTWASQPRILIPGILLLQNAGLQGLRVPKLQDFKTAGVTPVPSSSGSQIPGLQHQKASLVNLVVLHSSTIARGSRFSKLQNRMTPRDTARTPRFQGGGDPGFESSNASRLQGCKAPDVSQKPNLQRSSID